MAIVKGRLGFPIELDVELPTSGSGGNSFTDLQTEIDALPAGGGVVRMPAGIFNVTPPIVVDVAKSVSIRGVRGATIIKVAGDYPANESIFRIGQTTKVPFFGISDLTIDGNKAAQAGNDRFGLRGYQARHISLKSIRLTNVKDASVYTERDNDVDYLELLDCEVDNDGSPEAAVFTWNTKMVVIDGGRFHDTHTRGCFIREEAAADLTNGQSACRVVNATWENLGVSGRLGRLETMCVKGTVIDHNTLLNSLGSGNNSLYPCHGNEVVSNNAIFKFGRGIHFNAPRGVNNVGGSTATGNTIVLSGTEGILNTGVDRCAMTANIIHGSGKEGIHIKARDNLLMANILYGNAGSNIRLLSGANNRAVNNLELA